MHLQVRHVTKRFGDRVALNNVSSDIGAAEFVCLSGPSGCGKTRLLRMLLDAKVRGQLRDEIKAVQRDLRIPTLMVTHDQQEALLLSDRIVGMKDGVIAPTGRPQDLSQQPASRFVACVLCLLPAAVPGLSCLLALNAWGNPLNVLYGILLLFALCNVLHDCSHSCVEMARALRQFPEALDETARCLGASFVCRMFHILGPLALPTLTAVLLFMRLMIALSGLLALVRHRRPGPALLPRHSH